MKLASHPDIYGKKDVVIVSTDLYGPSEALKAFSKMTGTTLHEGKQTDEIEGLLKKFKDKEVVILDTPGQSPFTPNHLSKLEEYIKVLKPTDIFLVLSMSTDLKDLFLASAVYLLMKPTGVVFTKFDETTQPGKVFSILEELELPAVSFSEGKRVFIDAEPANVDYLFNKLFEMA
jgi:flagellar biosynthesis GTPase FlhF